MPLEPSSGRSPEQSLKSRKSTLFDEDEPASAASAPRRSFQDCLRQTPAAPLSTGLKATLWVVGGIVVVLLIAALATSGGKRPRPKLGGETNPNPPARVA
jgi:hypothetical protein